MMLRQPGSDQRGAILLLAGCLLPVAAAVGSAASAAAEEPKAPPQHSVKSAKSKPRERLSTGDSWRVRVSQYPIHMPDPAWLPPETWLFTVTGVEKTKEGARLMVTATREGSVKPTLQLQLDPETQAVMEADIMLPAQGGERVFVERPTPGEPYVSEMSPVPIVILTPTPAAAQTASEQGTGTTKNSSAGAGLAVDLSAPQTEAPASLGPAPAAPEAAGSGPPALFSFGPRFTQRTDPVDAGVGRAKIERGMEVVKQSRGSGLEPDGIARFLTVIEGAGRHIELVWDDTTPWPLYSQTDTSRSWLVTYTKGK